MLEKKEAGLSRKLMGLLIEEPRKVPRSGYTVHNADGDEIGFVTSGTQSITLNKGIALAYVSLPYSEPGTGIFVKIRKDHVPATVVKPPFIKN